MIDATSHAALAAEFHERRLSALSCAGMDVSDPDATFEEDHSNDAAYEFDSDERENLGAAMAWRDAGARLREAGAVAEGDSVDVFREVRRLLKVLAEIEGAGSEVGDAAEDALDLLRDAANDPDDPSSPNSLLDLAGRAAHAATCHGAATASLLFPVQGTSATLSVADLAGYLRQGAEVVR